MIFYESFFMISPQKNLQASNRVVLYLPSTPLNIIVCAAHAFQFRNDQTSVMVIIDQKQTKSHPYLKSLLAWNESPFIQIEVLPGKAKGGAKLKQRKSNFTKLESLIKTYGFDAIATGSDRRIEFQYAMHIANQLKSVNGRYMDDGLYSYAGRESRGWKDTLSAYLKKITYGMWWQEPTTVGSSNWIQEAFLFSPCQADIRLKKKQVNKIEASWFQNSALDELSQLLFKEYGLQGEVLSKIKQADLCILIPHPHNIAKIENYHERLQQLLDWAQQKKLKTVIKYHPRSEGEDRLALKQQFQVDIIPAEIAFEFVLTQFANNICVIGDVGTALLTAKWLRPSVKSMALLTGKNEVEQKMSVLLMQHGVEVKKSFNELKNEIKAC